MTTNYHTDVAAGASAAAATINAPLGQLDAKLNYTPLEYAATGIAATTVTTAGTYYAVTGFELSFTPAYTGQVFLISAVCGLFYAGTAGWMMLDFRITDGANATIVDSFIQGQNGTAAINVSAMVGGMRSWTAGAGDVGVARKVKAYVTHSVNASVVNCANKSITVVSH